MIRWIALDSWALMPFDIAGSTAGSSQNFASPLAQMTCTWIRASSREKKKNRYGPSLNTVGLTCGEHLLGDPARLAAVDLAGGLHQRRSLWRRVHDEPRIDGDAVAADARMAVGQPDELVLHAGRAPQEPRTYDVLHPLRQVRAYVGTDLFDLGAAQRHHGASSTPYTRASCPIHRPGGAGAPIRQVAQPISRLYKGYR